MKAELFRDAAGEWRFRIVAANGETVATGEGYTRRVDARTAALSLDIDEDEIEVVAPAATEPTQGETPND